MNNPHLSNDELYHYGILGMRWGIRRYQPYSVTGPRKNGITGKEIGEAAKSNKNANSSNSTLTPSQRKAKIRNIRKEIAKKEKLQNKAIREEERRIKSRAEFEKDKHKVLTSGNYNEILKFNEKHRGEITTNELREAINRINAENDLKKMAPHIKTGKEKLKDLSDILNNTANIGESGVRLYNVGAGVYNTLNLGSEKLPFIQTKGNNEKKEDKKKK